MADLESVEKRIERIANKARIQKDKESMFEMGVLTPIQEALSQGLPARSVPLSEEQRTFVNNNFHLLTLKPIVYVANVAEDDLMDIDNSKNYILVKEYAEKEGNEVVPVSCEIESELSELSDEDKKEMMETLGISESGLSKVIRTTYHLLNLSTFFTVGSDECRAWTFTNGMSAPECAGVIHTDFQKGFICAEVYTYDAIKELGSESAVKENGKIRREGRDYHPLDGDIMFFRFNV